jgi:sulfite exporter TauE/SafE
MSDASAHWITGVAFLLGLGGGVHCVAMCGGIAGALGQAPVGTRAPQSSAFQRTLLLSVGRIASYTLAGALVGALGLELTSWGGEKVGTIMRALLGAVIALTGLVLVGFTRLTAPLERLGARVWSHLSRLAPRVSNSQGRWRFLALGALWGWLPCGLVYAALTASLATSAPLEGAAFMFTFGLGTLPSMLAAGTLAGRIERWLRQGELRRAMGVLVVCYGLWTVAGAVGLEHPPHDLAAKGNAGHHHPGP